MDKLSLYLSMCCRKHVDSPIDTLPWIFLHSESGFLEMLVSFKSILFKLIFDFTNNQIYIFGCFLGSALNKPHHIKALLKIISSMASLFKYTVVLFNKNQ